MVKQNNISRHITLIAVIFLFSTSAIRCQKDDKVWDTNYPVKTDTLEQYGVPFDKVPETSDIIMYEINIRAFSESGDLPGIISQLDSVKKLGINVIWLMPVYPDGDINSVGSPYAVKDYTRIHPDYGDLEDLRLLVREAHNRDMAVILDWVANHTAWDHPWMKNKSWYVQDTSGNVIIPPGTNWQDVAELNYNNVDMRKEMIHEMKFWILEANADGYRCDYAEGVPVDFWRDAIDTLENIPGREIIMFAEAGKKELLSAGFQLIFGWNFYGKLKDVFNSGLSAGSLASVNASDYTGLSEDQQILRWITNHDENAWDNTPVEIFKGLDGALAAFVITSYMGGVPLIYSGQEVGCNVKLPFFENNVSKINWTINPDLKLQYEKIIKYRKNSEAIKSGSVISYSHDDVVAFRRIHNQDDVLVIANVRNTEVNYETPSALQHTTWQDIFSGTTKELSTEMVLQPFGYLVLKKMD